MKNVKWSFVLLLMVVVLFAPFSMLYAQADSAKHHAIVSLVERLNVQSRVLSREYVFDAVRA